MPVQLTINEMCERLGNPGDPVFAATINAIMRHAEENNTVRGEFVKRGRGYERVYSFTLDSEVPKKTYQVQVKDGKAVIQE